LALGGWEDGIGRSGLETLAQGIPLIAEVSGETLESYARLAGGPVPLLPVAELEQVVEQLDPRVECGVEGAEWSRKLLEPNRYFQMLRDAWSAA
jgi:hypothetical protein